MAAGKIVYFFISLSNLAGSVVESALLLLILVDVRELKLLKLLLQLAQRFLQPHHFLVVPTSCAYSKTKQQQQQHKVQSTTPHGE